MATLIAGGFTAADERFLDAARTYWDGSAAVRDATRDSCLESIAHASRVIAESLRSGGKLLICGNGGSAADSQHLAAELVGLLERNKARPALAAVALTTDSSVLTAIANDFGYKAVFERQVEAIGRAGDVLLGISTSGNSENVVRALAAARASNIETIVLTGVNGGAAGELADVLICVPSENPQHIQEMHLTLEHLLTMLVERHLLGDPPHGHRLE
jgi:D-sedoheptulose 7-phosphate isomerase